MSSQKKQRGQGSLLTDTIPSVSEEERACVRSLVQKFGKDDEDKTLLEEALLGSDDALAS